LVTVTLHCPHCGSEDLKRNGHAPNGKQKESCRACKRQSREHPTPHAYAEARREEILRAYEERSSLRGRERTCGVSRAAVISWIKKAEQLPALSETLVVPDANDADATILELDERWSFVLKKTHPAWVWIALCRKTRQVVAYAVGDRSERTCRTLWEAIPQASSERALLHRLLESLSGSDSQREQHTAVGKETGETAHVERWKNTLRQRLARFVRKTLSFSRISVHA
jgi:insertion element IS1 protein InsB